MATVFEQSSRFHTGGGGTLTWNEEGVLLDTTSSSSVHKELKGYIATNSKAYIFKGNPLFSANISIVQVGTTGSFYIGYGDVVVSGSGHTFTDHHAGFKIIISGGVATLYATQGTSLAETASSSLGTLSVNDNLDLYIDSTTDTSINYYFRLNGGNLSSITTLNTNVPASGTTDNTWVQASISNDSSVSRNQIQVASASYHR